MSQTTNEKTSQADAPKAEKPGMLKQFFSSLDSKMKAKAEEKSQQSSCCSGNDSGGKCC